MSSPIKIVSRREFLAASAKTAAGLIATSSVTSCVLPSVAPGPRSRIIGANNRINMAVIGIRSRGGSLMLDFSSIPNVRVKTLCDVDENLFPERVQRISEIEGVAPNTHFDLRRVFDDPDIDAVAIAAPNHWHALATIWACQAGKHVYVEKPSCHNIWEGRKMIEAARKYDRIVEVGFQNRSITNVRQAIKFLHDGNLGKVYLARGLCYKPRESLGRCPDGYGSDYKYYVSGQRGPNYDREYLQWVHYDLWQGPAPLRPFNYNRFHYNWHWNWDYGNGDIGNQGPHQFDVARWGLKQNEHPRKIRSMGGYYAFDSAQETANTQAATFEYRDGRILQFEVRGIYTNAEDSVKIGNLFYGSKGWMLINGSTWKTYFGRNNEPGPGSNNTEAGPVADAMNLAGAGGGGHAENFIYALRSSNREDLTCDISEGYMSSALPHLANISYRLGRDLTFDGKRERFVGDRQANRYLTRKYRKPYVVPEKV